MVTEKDLVLIVAMKKMVMVKDEDTTDLMIESKEMNQGHTIEETINSKMKIKMDLVKDSVVEKEMKMDHSEIEIEVLVKVREANLEEEMQKKIKQKVIHQKKKNTFLLMLKKQKKLFLQQLLPELILKNK